MFSQYFKFFINGGLLGVVGWGLHLLIYQTIAIDSPWVYALTSALTYLLLLVLNFFIQRSWIFNRNGLFFRFVLSNLSIMALVSVLSPVCRYAIHAYLGAPWGDLGGFMLAALLSSIPSFLLVRNWVFSSQT
jgi:hypothetical protein